MRFNDQTHCQSGKAKRQDKQDKQDKLSAAANFIFRSIRDQTRSRGSALTARAKQQHIILLCNKTVVRHLAAVTEPVQAGALMRVVYRYQGHLYGVIKEAQWHVPGSKMKMNVEHPVPLSRQTV